MGIGKTIPKGKVKPSDKEIYWVEIDGSAVGEVALKKSREVALESVGRRRLRSGLTGDRHKVRSARVNPQSDGITESGIQIYRLWFRFLKLALELEDLGVNRLVVRQGVFTKRSDLVSGMGGAGSEGFKLKDTIPFKIRKDKYEHWDLDEVLNNTFDKWWKTHSYLFEGHSPSLVKTTGNLDPDFLYVRIDKTSKLEDVRNFITTEIKPNLTGKPRYAVSGYPRPDVIQNRYNALVLTLKGWTAQDICTGGAKENIYLRATDMFRSKDDRLSVGITKKGKVLWSSAVAKQRNGGLHHLQDVMKGRFGDVPTEGVK